MQIRFVVSYAIYVLCECVIDARFGYNCLSNDYVCSQRDLFVRRKRHFAPQAEAGNV
jgi:hypothetical protein